MLQGERIKKIRNTLGLTLEKFSLPLGVTKTAVSRIEKSERNLTDQMAKAICREYNVNYDYLVNGNGDMFTALPQTLLDELCLEYNLTDFDRAFIETYITLPKEDRCRVNKYLMLLFDKLTNSNASPL